MNCTQPCNKCQRIVSYKYRKDGIIFIHNRKCAGSSMSNALRIGGTHDKHQAAWEAKMRIGDEKWEKAFKFSFIRNPWDRWVALYLFRFKNPRTKRMVPEYPLYDTPEQFKRYTLHIINQRLELLGVQWGLPPSYWSKFTLDGETSAIDFVGRYENIEEDWKKLCHLLKVPQLGERLRNINPTPRTRRVHYTEYYDDETRDAIARVYQRDIEEFEYEF